MILTLLFFGCPAEPVDSDACDGPTLDAFVAEYVDIYCTWQAECPAYGDTGSWAPFCIEVNAPALESNLDEGRFLPCRGQICLDRLRSGSLPECVGYGEGWEFEECDIDMLRVAPE